MLSSLSVPIILLSLTPMVPKVPRSQPIRDRFPSDCLGSCSLCLEEGWVAPLLSFFFCLRSSQTEPTRPRVSQPHKPGCDKLALRLFKSLRQFEQLGCRVLPPVTALNPTRHPLRPLPHSCFFLWTAEKQPPRRYTFPFGSPAMKKKRPPSSSISSSLLY